MTNEHELQPAEREAPPKGLVPAIGITTIEGSQQSADGLIPPRKQALNNRLLTSKGGAKLQQPDPEVVAAVLAASDKLHYFGIPDNQAFLEHDHKFMGDSGFSKLIMQPLIEKVKEDFPEHPILTFRGGMASINGTQKYEYGHSQTIPDITELVKNGGDREGVFNAASSGMDNPTANISRQLHRVNQYAADTDMRRLDIGSDAPDVAETLFPVISVYDSAMLRTAGGNYWAVKPMEGVTASDALLATYLLDCPVF